VRGCRWACERTLSGAAAAAPPACVPSWQVLAIRLSFEPLCGRMSPLERCSSSGCPLCTPTPTSARPSSSPICVPWNTIWVNYVDPLEATLASALRKSAHENIASISATKYSYAWKKVLPLSSSFQQPRCPLPADDSRVALYLQSVALTSTFFSN
jgi:hypothetical protein